MRSPLVQALSRAKRKIRRLSFSGRFAAVLGYIFSERWTNPGIAELIETSDGWLLIRHTDEAGASLLGPRTALDDNLSRLADMAKLSPLERGALFALSGARIRRPTQAYRFTQHH